MQKENVRELVPLNCEFCGFLLLAGTNLKDLKGAIQRRLVEPVCKKLVQNSTRGMNTNYRFGVLIMVVEC